MKQVLIIALLAVGIAACNNAGNPASDMRDSAAIEERKMDTNLKRPQDTMMKDTIRMDSTNRPKGGTDSIRSKY